MDDFEGHRTSAEEVTADMGRRARDLELEVEPEDVAELLQFHNRTWMDEELFLTDEQRKWFFEKESPGFNHEDCWNDNKGLEDDINLTAESERTDSNFERSTVGEMLSKQHCMLQRNCLWKEDSTGTANFSVLFF